MKSLIISFKSRNELYFFAKYLRENFIYSSIINSPKGVASSCTLSIKTDFQNLEKVKKSLNKHSFKSFNGLFLMQQSSFGNQILKIS